METPYIVFGQPDIQQAEIDEVVDSLQKNWIGTGPKVAQFEKAFAAYKGSPYAMALNSCTAGLHLCCQALDLKPGDEIITTAMTFCATVNAIIHAGGTPVLADVDPNTGNLSAETLQSKITSRTRAILPVHFAGRPCDMDAIVLLAENHNLTIIEDCAHAIETELNGKKAGTFGEFGVFSFYATKNVVTGEGGMVVSQNEKMMAWLKTLALHGMSHDAWQRFSDDGYKHYFVEEAGFKYNMMDLQAAIGIHQLARVEDNWQKRRKVWECYQHAFQDLPLKRPAEVSNNMRHAYHLYTVQIDPQTAGLTRDQFLEAMDRRLIGTGVHYLAIPEHPYYRKRFQWKLEDYPHATKIGRHTVSLPLSPKLTDAEIEQIVFHVNDILRNP